MSAKSEDDRAEQIKVKNRQDCYLHKYVGGEIDVDICKKNTNYETL